MFTQRVEQWKGSDDSADIEFRRRITQGDACRCDGLRHSPILRYKGLRSPPWKWRQSTDKYGVLSDFVTPDPSGLWVQNDFNVSQGSRNRMQRCRSYEQLGSQQGYCSCNCHKHHCCGCRARLVRHRHECWEIWDPIEDNEQFLENSENFRTVHVVPISFVPSPAVKNSPDFFGDNKESHNKNMTKQTDVVNHYGPLVSRKVEVDSGKEADDNTNRSRSVQKRYSLERKYLQKNPNDAPKSTGFPIFKGEKSGEPKDSGSATTDCYSDTSKHVCSEFAEIPLVPTSIPRIHLRADSSPSLTVIEPEIPKKIIRDNAAVKEFQRESGHDTLMESLELLKHRKKEQERKSILVKTVFGGAIGGDQEIKTMRSQTSEKSLKIPEMFQDIPENQQKSRIKEFITYWRNRSRKHASDEIPWAVGNMPPEPLQTHYSLHENVGRNIAKTQTIVKNAVTSDAADATDSSSESKFITEIGLARERLQKVSRESDAVASSGDESKMQDALSTKGDFLSRL